MLRPLSPPPPRPPPSRQQPLLVQNKKRSWLNKKSQFPFSLFSLWYFKKVQQTEPLRVCVVITRNSGKTVVTGAVVTGIILLWRLWWWANASSETAKEEGGPQVDACEEGEE